MGYTLGGGWLEVHRGPPASHFATGNGIIGRSRTSKDDGRNGMRVFISWSGDTSKSIAEALRAWLPSVLQAVKPYFSPDDIAKGSRWSSEIAKELEECQVGLLCLTTSNLEAPWLMFEAGALSKSLSAARVCPLLFGVDPSDVKGPLVQFQAAPFSKEEMKKAVKTMNLELGASALSADVLENVFEKWWPELESKVEKILAEIPDSKKKSVRSDRDILEEILARVRAVPSFAPQAHIHPTAVEDMLRHLDRLMSAINDLPADERILVTEALQALSAPVRHIAQRLRPEMDFFQQQVRFEDDNSRRKRLDRLENQPPEKRGSAFRVLPKRVPTK